MQRLKRAEEVIEGPYELKELQAPVLRGFALNAFVNLFEGSVGDMVYPSLAQKSGVTQVLNELHVPDDPLFRADVSPIHPDTPEPEAEPLPPPPPQPAAGTPPAAAAATAAEAICGAITHALKAGLLPHEQLLAAEAAAAPVAAAAAAPVAAAAAAAAEGPLPPRPFTGGATVVDYVRAYRSGATTPTEVAERIIAFVEAGGGASGPAGGRRPAAAGGAPHVGWFAPGGWRPEQIRKEAEECAQRLREGRARSLLEGVPFAVKDAADALPYPTTCGTTFVAAERTPTGDAPCVAALRALGCLLLGKTAMHEIGLGITGLNVASKATAINPFSPGLASPAAAAGADGAKPAAAGSNSNSGSNSGSGSKHLHYTGGSSSGTAGVLAAGVCPIAIGSDGGGSIRIPSAFCGLAGLKPTNGRVSGLHCTHVDCTVATLGPMAGCVQDVALMYAAMCGGAQWADAALPPPSPGLLPDEPLPVLLPSPWPRLPAAAAAPGGKGPLQGLRIGVYDKWFDDAAPTVVAACRAALAAAERCGATVVGVCVPDLERLRVAHTVTIVSEMAQNFRERVTNPRLRSAFNPESRLALSNTRFWNSADYIQAQRIRARANVHFRRVLSQVHVIATPTTPIPSPRIHPAALTGGESNLQQVSRVMRFIVAPNMVGLPALSLPVGLVPAEEDRTAAGPSSGAVMLPAGLQLIGRPQEEATLLRVGAVLEAELAKAGVAAGGAPPVHINPITEERRGL